jgi:hypothetical protein
MPALPTLLPMLILHVVLCIMLFTCVWICLVPTGFTSALFMPVLFSLFTCGIKRCPNIEYTLNTELFLLTKARHNLLL